MHFLPADWFVRSRHFGGENKIDGIRCRDGGYQMAAIVFVLAVLTVADAEERLHLFSPVHVA